MPKRQLWKGLALRMQIYYMSFMKIMLIHMYFDHKNIIMETKTIFANHPIERLHLTFAQQIIGKRIHKIQKGVLMSSYGEYLYGDHVDSPSYDDYLDINSGDRE